MPLPLPEERRRAEPMVAPPDPEAPAGPPPAFDATPLQRAREAAFAPADLIARDAPPPAALKLPEAEAPAPEPEPAAPEAPAADEAPRAGAAAPPEEAPRAEAPRRAEPDVALRERMETEVAEVRRMAEPEPDRALDLTR